MLGDMIDFLKHMTPDESRQAAHARDVAEFAALPAEELCKRVEYYLANCEFPRRWQPGEPVYDGVIAHVAIPELLRRIRGG